MVEERKNVEGGTIIEGTLGQYGRVSVEGGLSTAEMIRNRRFDEHESNPVPIETVTASVESRPLLKRLWSNLKGLVGR